MPCRSCSTKPNLPSVEMVRTRSAGNVIQPGGGNDYFYKEKNFQLLLAAQLELVTQAIICNAAPIIGLMPMYATGDFDFALRGRARRAHHNGLSHTMYQAARAPLRPVQLAAQHRQPATSDTRAAVRDRAEVVHAPSW